MTRPAEIMQFQAGADNRQHRTGQSVGRIERQEARNQRSNVLAVVAAEGLASKQINHLQRLVSNPGAPGAI